MELFLCVLADIIHFFTIFIICKFFFSFHIREVKYGRLMLIGAFSIVSIISVLFYFYNNNIIEACVYVVSMVLLGMMIYREKAHCTVIVMIWTLFASSVVGIMTSSLWRVCMLLFNINGGTISNLAASVISLIVIYSFGRAYKKKTTTTLQEIGYGNLIGFSILLLADMIVVSAIIAVADMYEDNRRNLYLIAVILIIIGIFIQLGAVIILFAQRNVLKEKEQITDAYLTAQKNHYEYLENREKETKKFRHDLRSHMEMISNLAQNQKYDKIDEYLEQMNMKIDTFGHIVTVHNAMVDAIINQYYAKAKENGITMKVEGKFPVDCAIEAYDLCTIFSNVLSNAYEAAMETEEKLISLVCGYTERNIIITVENSSHKELSGSGFHWRSKKENADYHGYGLENIKDSVKKYDGIFDIEIKDNRCMLRISFNHKGDPEFEELE